MPLRLGPYEIVSELGRGGMGTVLRARTQDGTTVAIKILLPRSERAAAAALFAPERELLSQLGAAEGFVPLIGYGESGSGPYLVMPFLSGGTLRERLRTPITLDESVALVRKLGTAIARAHAR